MAIFIEQTDYDFILSSEKLCAGIDKYGQLLNLNLREVEAYRQDTAILIYVFNNAGKYRSCVENFIRYRTRAMRPVFARLVHACRSSKSYNMTIGHELGIDDPVHAFGYN